jgi:hypothetical protein
MGEQSYKGTSSTWGYEGTSTKLPNGLREREKRNMAEMELV